MSSIVSEIASASIEQSTDIGEVTAAVRQMDQVTQQNAALIDEVANASQSMDKMAVGMESLVGFFETNAVQER